jgi:hypothetical protein
MIIKKYEVGILPLKCTVCIFIDIQMLICL